jgi:hypothetical protein
MMDHDRMQRSVIDWHTSESVGDKKPIWKQETAKRLAHAKSAEQENYIYVVNSPCKVVNVGFY